MSQIESKQLKSADLRAIAGLSTTGLVERTGAGTAATRSIGAGGAAVVAAADAAAVRTAAGLGTIATQPASDVAITGGQVDGVKLSATLAFNSSVDLTKGVWAGVDTTARLVFSDGTAATAWTVDNDNGNFRWFTPGNTRMYIRASDSMLTAFGPIASRLYTPQTIPAANSLTYGAQVVVYNPLVTPTIFIAWTDLTNWHRASSVPM